MNNNDLNISRSQNIHYSDKDDYDIYKRLWFDDKNYELAISKIKNTDSFLTKKTTETILNEVMYGIEHMEQIYVSEYINILADNLEKFQAYIDNYKPSLSYSNQTQYNIGEIVINNSISYLCILKPPIGTLTTDEKYWVALILKGDTGSSGIGANLRNNPTKWNSTLDYDKYDVVSYTNNSGLASEYSTLYIAKNDNTNNEPPSSTENWLKLIEVKRKKITSSTESPTDTYDGCLWLQEI